MENKRRSLILLIIGIATIFMVVLGAAFAFLQTGGSNIGIGNVGSTTGTIDSLTLATEGEIALSINEENFGLNMGDKVATTTAMASLIANNTTNQADETYNIYLVINENTFLYTNGVENPEIMLSIKKNGSEYTNVQDLNLMTGINIEYPTDEEGSLKKETISGYDITTKSGLIKIAEEEKITANGLETVDNWEIRIIFRNLDLDQSSNGGKKLTAKLIIQKNPLATNIMDVCQSNSNLADCLVKLHNESEYVITKLLYHDQAEDYPGEINYELEAGDLSYRYSGASAEVNNYVCFGTDTCSGEDDSHLYRIIGAFKNSNDKYEVKLIKATEATATELGNQGANYSNKYYKWNGSSNLNVWKDSNLNTVNLNDYYLNTYLDTKWEEMIESHLWQVAGNDKDFIRDERNAFETYDYEVGNNKVTLSNLGKCAIDTLGTTCTIDEIVHNAKIGLMYLSDYMYAAKSLYWSYKGYISGSGHTTDYGATLNNDWLHIGDHDEHTLTRLYDSDHITHIMSIASDGHVSPQNTDDANRVRPTFYLKTSVKIVSGDGTINNPYIISE